MGLPPRRGCVAGEDRHVPAGKGRKKILGISKKVVSLYVEDNMGLSSKLLRNKMTQQNVVRFFEV